MPDTPATPTAGPAAVGPTEGLPDEPRPVHEDIDGDLAALGEETAQESRQFLAVVRQVASGASPEQAIPLLLLAISQILVTGARLGAINDVVPAERYEADLGQDFDGEKLRDGLSALLAGVDDFVVVADPLTNPEVTHNTLSGEIAEVASALVHGLRHYAEGRVSEALWWWQFSYLSDWGDRAASALRALHSIMSHIRLDADEDTVAEAEFDALHR